MSRNTDTTNPLTVTLASSDTGEATVPATVTIAAGQTISAPFSIDAVDEAVVDATQTVTVTASAIAHADGSDTVDVTDDDVVPTMPGDIDGDQDFDANDSFLIHLVKLSGTNTQIDQSKGASPLSADEIRAVITQLSTAGDVDGDGDFDANDSFLIHLVKLSGTDAQIDQSKSSSSLTATAIRANVNGLGGESGTTSVVAESSQAQSAGSSSAAENDDTVPSFFNFVVRPGSSAERFQTTSVFRSWS